MLTLVLCFVFDYPKGAKSRTKPRRGRDGAGASGHGGADGVNPTVTLPIQTNEVDNATGLPLAQLNPTEVRSGLAEQQLKGAEEARQQLEQSELTRQQLNSAGGARRQQDQVDGADHQLEQEMEGEVESSHAGVQDGRDIGVANRGANQLNQLVESSMKDVLDAIKLIRSQMLAMTQVFTPLVNSQWDRFHKFRW